MIHGDTLNYIHIYIYIIHIDRDADALLHVEVICTQGTSGAPRSATGPPRRRRCAGRCCRWAGWLKIPWGKPWRKPGKHADFMGIWGFSEHFFGSFWWDCWSYFGFWSYVMGLKWLEPPMIGDIYSSNQKMDIYIYTHTAMGYNIIWWNMIGCIGIS